MVLGPLFIFEVARNTSPNTPESSDCEPANKTNVFLLNRWQWSWSVEGFEAKLSDCFDNFLGCSQPVYCFYDLTNLTHDSRSPRGFNCFYQLVQFLLHDSRGQILANVVGRCPQCRRNSWLQVRWVGGEGPLVEYVASGLLPRRKRLLMQFFRKGTRSTFPASNQAKATECVSNNRFCIPRHEA